MKDNEITGEMFLIPANKYIYYAVEYLYSKKQDPSPVAVIEVLKDKTAKKAVEDFGGIEYLTILNEQNVSLNNIDILCEKLKQAYTKNELYKICDENKAFLMSDKTEVMNPTELITDFEIKINDLNNKVQQTSDIYKMGSDTERVLELRANTPNTVPGLELGWSKLDYYTNGGQPGDLIMVCARAKTGKSMFL